VWAIAFDHPELPCQVLCELQSLEGLKNLETLAPETFSETKSSSKDTHPFQGIFLVIFIQIPWQLSVIRDSPQHHDDQGLSPDPDPITCREKRLSYNFFPAKI
jgi:hypothetical protein